MFRQGLEFHFEISQVEITKVNCIIKIFQKGKIKVPYGNNLTTKVTKSGEIPERTLEELSILYV